MRFVLCASSCARRDARSLCDCCRDPDASDPHGASTSSPSCRRIWSNDLFADGTDRAPAPCDGASSEAGSACADDDGRFVWDGSVLRIEDGRRHYRAVRRRGPRDGGGGDGDSGQGRGAVGGDGHDSTSEARCAASAACPAERLAVRFHFCRTSIEPPQGKFACDFP
jgi:hypothetical protein